MSIAQRDRPAARTGLPGDAPPTGTVVRSRLTHLRHTSPGRLQLLLALLLTLGLCAALVAGVAANAASTGTGDLGDRAQPLLTEAETIYSALADADTTAAQAFLGGGLEPPELTDRYDEQLSRAATALTSAARRTPADGEAAAAVERLTAGLAEYAGLVAAARANNRQGLPIGAAYLANASTLNRDELQPQAQVLFRAAQRDVDAGYAAARSTGWVAPAMLLYALLLAALLATQRHLSRTTKRTFNVPLAGATALTVLLAGGSLLLYDGQRDHLDRAAAQGSHPVALLAEARILALRERADEALSLAARGGGESYDDDFDLVADRLGGPSGLLQRLETVVTGPALEQVRAARSAQRRYRDAHDDVRRLDTAGDHEGAVALALGDTTTGAYDDLVASIGGALDDRRALFAAEIDAAGRGLGVLTVLGPLLALAVCALAVLGLRARLEEYR